jgi:hypothetical protein
MSTAATAAAAWSDDSSSHVLCRVVAPEGLSVRATIHEQGAEVVMLRDYAQRLRQAVEILGPISPTRPAEVSAPMPRPTTSTDRLHAAIRAAAERGIDIMLVDQGCAGYAATERGRRALSRMTLCHVRMGERVQSHSLQTDVLRADGWVVCSER